MELADITFTCGCPHLLPRNEIHDNEMRWLSRPEVVAALAAGKHAHPVVLDKGRTFPFAYRLCEHGGLQRFGVPIHLAN